jgi:hypothetical protein
MTESLTIAQFEELIGDSYALDAEIERYEKETLAPMRQRLRDLDAKILAQLEAEDKSSYKSKFGTVVRTRRYTVRIPQLLDDKVEFFKWLNTKGRDVYWKYTTVNSQALNALYKAEMEIAKEEGNVEFKIPGLGGPELAVTLSRRSK